MNAYELADQLDNVKYQNGAKPFEMYANMLRQQADRIAELERQLNTQIHPKTKLLTDDEIEYIKKISYSNGWEAGKYATLNIR